VKFSSTRPRLFGRRHITRALPCTLRKGQIRSANQSILELLRSHVQYVSCRGPSFSTNKTNGIPPKSHLEFIWKFLV
jgi:hypothetical protein